MATTADFRNGMVIDFDGVAFRIAEFMHVKPGKGGAFVRTKLKNVLTGAVIERTFRAGEKVTEVRLERRDAQYLYSDGEAYHFMDMETYDQFTLSLEQIGRVREFLKESDQVQLLVREGQPFLVEISTHVVLDVAQTDPGLRGDTAQGGTKQATLETGLVVNVPLFIDAGDRLKIDTRTGEYIERVGK